MRRELCSSGVAGNFRDPKQASQMLDVYYQHMPHWIEKNESRLRESIILHMRLLVALQIGSEELSDGSSHVSKCRPTVF